MGIIRIKVPLLYLLLSAAVFLSLGLFLRRPAASALAQTAGPAMQQLEELRRKDRQLIQPLILADVTADEPMLAPLKSMIENYLLQKTQSGEIRTASVYFRDFTTSRSFAINPTEEYSPASIMKIPVLITYLKEAQTKPGRLKQKLHFGKHNSGIPEQTLTGQPMVERTDYSIDELLQRMIIDSDNDATAVLNNNIDLNGFKVLFRVLGFNEPDLRSWNYNLTVAECSRFMRILFYSTYLDEEHSEAAMRLLTKTGYKEGFTRHTDSTMVVAHKFGERNVDNEQQLHETAIFYLGDTPYLLTVMTKGKDKSQLPAILAEVSRMTWQYLQNRGV